MTLVDDFTFQLGDTGVVLNTSPSLPFVDITRVVGLSSPPFRETERQHEGQDGAFMDAEFEEGRRIVLEGEVYADPDDMEEYLDLLKSDFAPQDDPVPLYLLAPGRPERLVFVKPLGMRYEWDSLRRLGSARAQFSAFAEDPRIYTSTLKSVNIDLSEPSHGGFGFETTIRAGLYLPGDIGAYVSTPDAASLDITGDIDLRAEGEFGSVKLDDTVIGLSFDGTSGDYASTPDTAALDIVGDIDLRIDLTMDSSAWTDTNQKSLLAKFVASGNQI